eukprot:Gb_41533 [translate_table: standard]
MLASLVPSHLYCVYVMNEKKLPWLFESLFPLAMVVSCFLCYCLKQEKRNIGWFLKPKLNIYTNKHTLSTTSKIKTSARQRDEGLGNVTGTSSPFRIDIRGGVKMLCKQGQVQEALQCLHLMNHPDSSTYASLLRACVNKNFLPEGKLIHAHIIHTGCKSEDIFLETKLVIMYTKCGSLVNARRVFEEMPERNVVSWTTMIAAYAKHGHGEEALTLFHRMQRTGVQPDHWTFTSVLPACATLAALEHGKEVHEEIIRNGCQYDIFAASALVDMYAKCGNVEDAHQVFEKIPGRNVVLWNAMIAGYTWNGRVNEAITLFKKMPERDVISWTAMISSFFRLGFDEEAFAVFDQMQRTGIQPNEFTFASVLSSCSNLAALEHGKEVHEHIIRSGFLSNCFVASALIDMYVKCGRIKDARNTFEKMPERNVVSWTAMIAGYTQLGHVNEALNLFQKMPEQNLVSWNTMISGCTQNGYVDEALWLFQKMPEHDVVSWNAIIAGYAQNGLYGETLKLFQQMQLADIKADFDTFASVLPACANLATLAHGKEIHEEIIRSGFQSDVFVGSALVDMYTKCGSIEDACKVFDNMPRHNVVSWTAMIVGYAMHGCGNEALHIFEQMQHSGMTPDHVTFIGVLSACCHAGLVDDGWQYFYHMSQDYHITPVMEHYCCMVDLLGRAGHLIEAYEFILKMPIIPNAAVWGSLLGACRVHMNVDLGEHVAEHLFELDPENAAHYVLLSNMYADTGKWDGIEKVRQMMRDKSVKKQPGCSWIEVNNKVYTFLVGD